MNKGRIVHISGPVTDVRFDGEPPRIKDALYVIKDGKKLVMEVAQQIKGDVVRCIMLGACEGLSRGTEVYATGDVINVPVAQPTKESGNLRRKDKPKSTVRNSVKGTLDTYAK